MRNRWTITLIGLALCATAAIRPARADDNWRIVTGETTISLDPGTLSQYDLWLAPINQPELTANEDLNSLSFLVDAMSVVSVDRRDNMPEVRDLSIGHVAGFAIGGARRQVMVDAFAIVPADTGPGRYLVVGLTDASRIAFVIDAARLEFDADSGAMTITTDDLRLSSSWAAELGRPSLADRSLGSLTFQARLHRIAGEVVAPVTVAAPVETGTTAGDAIGPDVVVAQVGPSALSYGNENGISAFAVSTTSCNMGDQVVMWEASNNRHPVIAQNMYRLKSGRFEQIGMAWLKHGFAALAGNTCGVTCQPPGTTTRLGVGCSDPYSAYLNGDQPLLGPRSEVNAYTGFFTYPFTAPPLSDSVIERRLQVRNTDIDPGTNSTAMFFVEAHYVTADEAAAGNGDNNASYRRAFVAGPTLGNYSLIISSSTQREQPAIRAWKDQDDSVTETDIHVPNEGLFLLAAKSTDIGSGFYQYEYALQNLNSDRSGGSFRVPLPEGAVIESAGFHDVDYHSGEPYSGASWAVTINGDSIAWSTTTHSTNPNANALRWSTLYNFRFQTNAPPANTTVTLGLFKPGFPTEVAAESIGPELGLVDCNDNDRPDGCDISCDATGCEMPCGTSTDCNANGVPDECEPDCNDNGLADACDIGGGESDDCNENTVPDECEPDCDDNGIPDDCDVFLDCDEDGIFDCFDLCPCTNSPGTCVCPAIDRCCFFVGVCIGDYPRNICLEQGGTPDCLLAPCHDGCLIGDGDLDGDLDLKDSKQLASCFSGSSTAQDYVAPDPTCIARYDYDNDGDVDSLDYRQFRMRFSGPTSEIAAASGDKAGP